MSEKAIEDAIKHHIRACGGWVVKLHADGLQGRDTLDLVGAYRGRPFWIEVKASDGTLSPIQQHSIDRARRTGYVSGAVTSVSEFEGLFNERNQTGTRYTHNDSAGDVW